MKKDSLNFSDVAQIWDTPERTARAEKVAMTMKEALNLTGDKRVKKGLEFGCGTGLVGFMLTDLIEELSFVDPSEGMIEVVNEKIEQLGATQVKGYCTDLIAGNFEDQDLIFSSMAMHHIVDLKPVFERIRHGLKEGGRLCIVDLDSDLGGQFHSDEDGFEGHDGFDQVKLAQELEEYGLKTTLSRTFFKATKLKNEKEIPYSLFILVAEKM